MFIKSVYLVIDVFINFLSETEDTAKGWPFRYS